ncbi:hypothetical protein AMTRI_Chr08g205980 [Amborella trichopoda]
MDCGKQVAQPCEFQPPEGRWTMVRRRRAQQPLAKFYWKNLNNGRSVAGPMRFTQKNLKLHGKIQERQSVGAKRHSVTKELKIRKMWVPVRRFSDPATMPVFSEGMTLVKAFKCGISSTTLDPVGTPVSDTNHNESMRRCEISTWQKDVGKMWGM